MVGQLRPRNAVHSEFVRHSQRLWPYPNKRALLRSYQQVEESALVDVGLGEGKEAG